MMPIQYLKVRPQEVRLAVVSCAFFFLVLSSLFILRPMREAFGLAGGSQTLTKLFMGTLVLTLLMNPVYAWIAGRFQRRQFIAWIYRFLMLNLLLFALTLLLNADSRAAGYIFYVWLSMSNMLAIAVFWSVMVDVFTLEQSKRLFPLIAVGGTLGAIAGSALTTWMVDAIGPVWLMAVSIVLLELAARCAKWLVRHSTAQPVSVDDALTVDGIAPGMWRGIAHVGRSPYLLAVCAYILCLTISATFLYFIQANIVEATAESTTKRAQLFGWIDLATQSLTLMLQLLATNRLLEKLGVGLTLCVLPCLSIVGFLALLAAPTFITLFVVQVLNRAGKYAVSRPARETLYTVISREDKYKAKGFIDTFVYRGGDAIGAATERVLGTLGFGLVGLSGVAVPMALFWMGIGVLLGSMQSRLSKRTNETILAPSALEPT